MKSPLTQIQSDLLKVVKLMQTLSVHEPDFMKHAANKKLKLLYKRYKIKAKSQIYLELEENNGKATSKVKTYRLYELDELEPSAREKAISNLGDCNVEYDWWESLYSNARDIGVEICSFDLNRRELGCKIMDSEDTANKILSEYTEGSELYKSARKYFAEKENLVRKYSNGTDTDQVDPDDEDKQYEFDNAMDEVESDFDGEVREEFLSMLHKEYDYLTSEEQVIETIKANGYTFTAEGKLQN